MVNDLVSVVVRFHDPSRVSQLDEALFSLSTQSYQNIQVVLAVQNGSSPLIQDLEKLLSKQPFLQNQTDTKSLVHKVISVPIPAGTDGRSYLLNTGIQAADGQYLAFLDYDDVVYPQSYDLLLQNIQSSSCPIAVGGCRLAFQRWTTGTPAHLFTESKRPYLLETKNKLDLFANNFIPIHSFLVDRSRIDSSLLKFDVSLKCFEDYEVLLKLASRYEFDFRALETPIVEYRIRNDGSNTIPTSDDDRARKNEWQEAGKVIQELKKSLQVSVNAADLQKLVEERDRLLLERKALTFQIAGFVVSFSNRFPRLKSLVLAQLRWVGRKAMQTRRLIARSIRYND